MAHVPNTSLAGSTTRPAARQRRFPSGRPRGDRPTVWSLIDSRSVGGAERHITTLAQALGNSGIQTEVVLFADYGPNPWLEQLDDAGVACRVLPGTLAGLVRALRENRPNLLHTHGYKAGILGRAAALRLGIPLVSTFHTGLRSPGLLGAYEWLDEFTSFVGGRIAVSEGIGRRLPFSSEIIPSWVAAPDVAPSGSLPRQVGFVGRLSAEKNPELFCWLAAHAPPGPEWHVYGDGPLRPELERRYGANVRFHGVVSDMDRIWPTLGLLVMPSRFEGLPLAALEALSHGIPVLASRVGGLPSAVIHGRSGWLFAADDPAGALTLVEIWCCLDKDAQRRLRQSCWEHVRAEFSEAAMLPKILAVYERAGLRVGLSSTAPTAGAAGARATLARVPLEPARQ